jgi:UDP-3-O-[3-hydroxymyristoyl] N-acetylglucosamine deacetylase
VLQRTVRQPLTFDGVGLHSGHTVRAVVRPAPVDHGIAFRRVDLPGTPIIPARVDHVVRTTLATTLGAGNASVSTVEHLIAALHGHGIDNVLVEVDGPEIPILDGSALPFVEALSADRLEPQGAPKQILRVVQVVEARDPDEDRWCRLEPHDGLAIDCSIAFSHPLLHDQRLRFAGGPSAFAAEIAPARTFGLLADVERMRSQGLARGGSLDNAVVLGDDGVLNPEGLRFPDECVRHKVLDMIGDLALLGAPVLGRFRAHRSGHAFNLSLVRQALERGAVEFDTQDAPSLSASG